MTAPTADLLDRAGEVIADILMKHCPGCGPDDAVGPDIDHISKGEARYLARAFVSHEGVELDEQVMAVSGGSLDAHHPDLAVYLVVRIPMRRLEGCTVEGCTRCG